MFNNIPKRVRASVARAFCEIHRPLGLLLCVLLFAHASFAAAEDGQAVRRWVGMMTLAVQEYGEGMVDGRIVDETELAAADAMLAQLLQEAPSQELDRLCALVGERAPVADVRLAAAAWFEIHAVGVEPERPSQVPSIAAGKFLFARYCTSCHGVDADGAGALAEHIEGAAPADFTDAEFMGGETPEEFFQAMTLGVPGTAMPAWGDILGERDRWDLVAFLWSVRGPAEVTDTLVVCATCHGSSGGAANLTEPGAMADVTDAELAQRATDSVRHGGQEGMVASELVAAARLLSVVQRRPGEESRAVDPKHVSLSLRLISEEYVDAVRDGQTVSAVDYGEARLFHARLAADIDQLAAEGKLAEKLGARDLVEALGQAILMRQSAEVIEARTTAVAEVVLPALGVEAQDRTADVMAAVSRLVASARRTAISQPQRAASLLLDAYIEFEPVERRVGARDPGLIAEVERRFSSLRGELGAGRNDVSGFDALEASLSNLETAGEAPDSWYGGFIASLLIIVREGLEVILVVSALAAYLSKGGHLVALRWLYGGAWVGIGFSIVTAFLLDKVLDNVGVGKEVLEGVTMLVAAGVLFSVSYWLISKVEARRWQDYIQRSLNRALGQSSNFAMAGVSFLAVYREGFETVLFYRALAVDVAVAPVVGGFLLGSVALAALWIAITWFSIRIPLKPFFGLTGGLLYLLAFRFVGAGVGELQAAEVLAITPVGWWPDLSALAMAANMETGVVQLMLVVAAGIAAAVLWAGRGQKSV